MAMYQSYHLHNFKKIPQITKLTLDQQFDIEVVGHVLPFKTNNYVLDELINWENLPDDPMFILNFPQRDMLLPHHYQKMAMELRRGSTREQLFETANHIRMQLNPNPAGQKSRNVPELDGIKLSGMQHKYRETVLFFPRNGQTCHAYCTFCFRWPQFVGIKELRFANLESENLIRYIKQHKEITDILFTGGDPLTMSTRQLARYLDPIIYSDLPNLQTIRIGTKALSYWPYRFLTDHDADELLILFERIVKKGYHLAFMAHINHAVELSTPAVKKAIQRIRNTGAIIRTQSPLLRHINDDPDVWADMWRTQVGLNCIPYYMFIARDTGAQHYFALPLVKAHEIFQKAYTQISGICRTVRGPVMSCSPGKVQILGINEIPAEPENNRVITLRLIQGRDPEWVSKPFFAEYDENAIWMGDLKPAFGEKNFFFEKQMKKDFIDKISDPLVIDFE